MAFQFRTQYGWDSQPTEPSVATPPGFYPAKIVAAEEKYSKSGKPMLQLKLEIDAGGARTVDVNEYLLLDNTAPWKVEQYLAAIGTQFAQGQDVTITANTFLGGRLYVLTYNEPGVKNPERLYMKPLKAFRVQDVKMPGPLAPEQLEAWGLNHDGTRRGSKDEQRANAAWNAQPPQQNQGSWGQQAQPQRAPIQPSGWMPNEEDDDIPF